MRFVDTSGECWLWTGRLQPNGYGQFGMKATDGKWRAVYAHRIAYELFVGPIPEGMDVCHRCAVQKCVKSDHLFVGTRSDNMLDGRDHGRGCVLSMEKAEAIRSQYAQGGVPQKSLASEFHVSLSTIAAVLKQRLWPVEGAAPSPDQKPRLEVPAELPDDVRTRFFGYVERTPTCWLWTGSKNSSGYGNFWLGPELGNFVAHRISYVLLIGQIPSGFDVVRACGKKECVAPNHLVLSPIGRKPTPARERFLSHIEKNGDCWL